jgi:hypothetical protein
LQENTMPLVTLTVRKPKSAPFKAKVLDAVHAALVSAMVCFKETAWENWAFSGGRLIHT